MSTILKTKDGVELIVKKPSYNDLREAKKVYNTAFNDALKSKAFVRARLDDFLREQGLWNEEKAAKLAAIKKELLESEVKLEKGGIKLSDARQIALNMIRLRNEWTDLITQRSQLDNNTAEGQADNAQFEYLVWACLVYKDSGKPYYASIEDYLNSEDEVAVQGTREFSRIYYKLDDNFEAKLPEYKFLKKFKFVDEKLRFINKDKKLVDTNGKLIDENGNYINEAGEFVDFEGNKLDKDGNYISENQAFLDDDGKPVVIEEESKVVEEPEPVVSEPTEDK